MLRSLEIFERVIYPIACDLISCAVAGPAYLYALARFAPPDNYSNSRQTSNDHWRRGYPSLAERISCALGFLKWRGLDPHFASIYYQESAGLEAPDLFEWVLSTATSPYTPEDHKRAIGEIKRSLMKGDVIPSRPTLVLNALWDGVVRKSGYVDEMAAVSSINGSLRSDYETAVPVLPASRTP